MSPPSGPGYRKSGKFQESLVPSKWLSLLTTNYLDRVYCNAYILSKGLILVDLPGLRDLNTARRRITETYMREVDEIFAVCQIARAATDAGVLAVFELARRANLQNISVICTKSDVRSTRSWSLVIAQG